MSVPLFGRHFHNGYVVVNLDQAIENLRRNYGVENWKVIPLQSQATGLGMAFVRGSMIELVEVDTGQELMHIHDGWIPDTAAGAKLNHVAYMLDSHDEWQAAMARFQEAGVSLPVVGEFGDIFDYFYADTVEQLGHFSEFTCLRAGGKDFLAEIPQN